MDIINLIFRSQMSTEEMKTLKSIKSFAALGLIILFLSSCNDEKRDWETAKNSNTIPGLPGIVIWRDFLPNQIEEYTKMGLRPGYAFLKIENGIYQFIRKVDLNKNDEELWKEFGIK